MASLKTYARKSILVFMAIALVLGLASFSGVKEAQAAEEGDVAAIVSGMSLDEKISQMIIPAIRSWNGANVTDLGAVPELASALQKHQYGGVILYGANVVDVEQTTRLVSALQANNSQMTASTNIPYFMPVDEEGGVVLRFSMGTRMNGNMAVGATGDAAVANAQTSGKILGEECAAMGFNVDFAPVVDVNNNPANPVIGIRSFSDDPARVAELGAAYANGLGASNVIGTYKHFPGHGNTSVDSHLGTPSVTSTYEELKAMELVPFQTLIEQGADMIMTAHITYPNVDDEVVFGDGVTRGNYPATMSEKMMNQILRKDMGFNGVIVTDALEMGALYENALVPGEADSAEYSVNIAEKVINAGVDILLLPKDLNAPDVVTFYDDYIAGIAQLVENGTITEQRIDESVTRILNLKQKYGILGMVASGADVDQKVAAAKQIVGSEAHHADEAAIAKQAITLVKNESTTLPFSGYDSNIVLLCRDQNENALIANALTQLQETGVVASDAYVNNLASGQTSGSQNSSTKITIDYYYDTATSEMHYTDELKSAIAEANAVACLSKMFNLASLQPDGAIYQSISTLIADTHAAGGKFALISGHLPYDIARYSDVEAMVLAYMSSGTAVDPTDRNVNTGAAGAYNANIAAAYKALFDDVAPTGALPVNVPAMVAADDGTVSYADTIQHERGTSLRYAYQFTEGMGASHEGGSTECELSLSGLGLL